ncbi:MAG: hydrogenase maturation protease [Acidihalobacter sp.]
MKPWRVIGIGSPYGDDQVGWRVIDALTANATWTAYAADCAALACDRPGMALLSHLDGAQGAVLIDAVCSDAAQGTLLQLDPQTTITEPDSLSSHGFGVSQALALGRELGTLPDHFALLGIEIDPLAARPEFCDHPLSVPVAAAIDVCIHEIHRLLERWRET